MAQLISAHIWLFPAVWWNYRTVGLGGVVDDGQYGLEITVDALSDHAIPIRFRFDHRDYSVVERRTIEFGHLIWPSNLDI